MILDVETVVHLNSMGNFYGYYIQMLQVKLSLVAHTSLGRVSWSYS